MKRGLQAYLNYKGTDLKQPFSQIRLFPWSAYNHVSVTLVQRHSINAEFRGVPYSKSTVSINHVYHSKSSLHSLPCILTFCLALPPRVV